MLEMVNIFLFICHSSLSLSKRKERHTLEAIRQCIRRIPIRRDRNGKSTVHIVRTLRTVFLPIPQIQTTHTPGTHTLATARTTHAASLGERSPFLQRTRTSRGGRTRVRRRHLRGRALDCGSGRGRGRGRGGGGGVCCGWWCCSCCRRTIQHYGTTLTGCIKFLVKPWGMVERGVVGVIIRLCRTG